MAERLWFRLRGGRPDPSAGVVPWPPGERLASVLARLRRLHVPPQGEFPTGWKLLFLLGLHERESQRVCRRLIRRGMTVVDVGAHIGSYTRLFSRLVGRRGQVFAFEPHGPTFQLLDANAGSARLANVHAVQAAVGDQDGVIALQEMTESGRHSILDVSQVDATYVRRSGQEVALHRLDDYLPARGVTGVDFLKVDVEGAEAAVLRGARNILSASPDMALLVEYNARAIRAAGFTGETFLRSLEEHGFRLHQVDGRGRLQPLDPEGLPADGNVNLVGLKGRAGGGRR